jgi:hypothetical protein
MAETCCLRCDRVLPETMFTRLTRDQIGLSRECKGCQSKARKTEKHRKYQREYRRAYRARKALLSPERPGDAEAER